MNTLKEIEEIKHLVIIAIASDDYLLESLILKGGHALQLTFKDRNIEFKRPSFDVDYSLAESSELSAEELGERVKNTLDRTFLEHNYRVFDYKFLQKPKKIRQEVKDFWGGYKAEFKVIASDQFNADIDKSRRQAIKLKDNQSSIFELEISLHEYIEKTEIISDGYRINVYTVEMLILEKLRAICQQDPEYSDVIPSFTPRSRSKDFYDIFLLLDNFNVNLNTTENILLVRKIFEAKKVPLQYIQKIKENKEIHERSWATVVSTVGSKEKLEPFDFYFEFVISTFDNIQFP